VLYSTLIEPRYELLIGPIGTTAILVIILIAIILFGPQKIPELAKSLGEAVRIFREESRKLSEPPKSESSLPQKGKVTEEQLAKLADALGVEKEGKIREELIEEIIEKAKEKGLL